MKTRGYSKPQRIHVERELPAIAGRPDEVARVYGLSRATIYKFLNHPDPTKRLRSSKVGTARIIRFADVEALLDELRNGR